MMMMMMMMMLRYDTRCKGFHTVTYTPTRLSANGVDHAFVFPGPHLTDPWGMEDWVDLVDWLRTQKTATHPITYWVWRLLNRPKMLTIFIAKAYNTVSNSIARWRHDADERYIGGSNFLSNHGTIPIQSDDAVRFDFGIILLPSLVINRPLMTDGAELRSPFTRRRRRGKHALMSGRWHAGIKDGGLD